MDAKISSYNPYPLSNDEFDGLDDVIAERTTEGIKFSGIIFDYEPETVVTGFITWDSKLTLMKTYQFLKGYQFLGLMGVGYGSGYVSLFYKL